MKLNQTILRMGILASLLNFLGCSEQVNINKNSTDKSVNDTLKDDLSKMLHKYKNRPIYKKLTTEIIDSTPDDELIQTIFDNIMEKFSWDYSKEFETVLSLSKPRQAIYMIWKLEAEVNNGGFNQYYFNPSKQYADLTPNALLLVGANKWADLVKKANHIFELEEKKIKNHQDGTLEGFSKSYEDNPLNDLDTEFYDLYKIEDLHKLQVDFIRKNKQDFIDE